MAQAAAHLDEETEAMSSGPVDGKGGPYLPVPWASNMPVAPLAVS